MTLVIMALVMTSSCHDFETKMTVTYSIFGVSTRNKKCNIGYLSGHVSMALKFRVDIWVSKFWQVCNLRLPFHLFICLLFVREFHKNSRTSQPLLTKLGDKQVFEHNSCKFVGQECWSNNWVTGSIDRLNIEIVRTPSVFNLERWSKQSKPQNVGNIGLAIHWHTTFLVKLMMTKYGKFSKFRHLSKCSNFQYSPYLPWDMERPYRNYSYYDVTDDVTAWRQSRLSIFMLKWKCNIFAITW